MTGGQISPCVNVVLWEIFTLLEALGEPSALPLGDVIPQSAAPGDSRPAPGEARLREWGGGPVGQRGTAPTVTTAADHGLRSDNSTDTRHRETSEDLQQNLPFRVIFHNYTPLDHFSLP